MKEILMKDGCTQKEAERYLERGADVFDDFEEHFDLYMEDWGIEDTEPYKEMIRTHIPMEDWGIVTDNNRTYYIMYVI